MKKILITTLIILVISLTACNNSSSSYLKSPDSDIETCGDSCMTEGDFWQIIHDTEEERNYDVYFQDKDQYEMVFLSSGKIVNREELLRADKLNGTLVIPPELAYRPFGQALYQMRAFIDNCEVQNPCSDLSYLQLEGMTVSEAKYGFDEESGYYNFTVLDNDAVYRKESFRYHMYEGYTDYELYIYFPIAGQYEYTIAKQGVLHTYNYDENGADSYTYINTETYESLYYSYDNEKLMIEYLNPEDQLSYSYNSRTSKYEVASYQDFENIVALNSEENNYSVIFNFHFMSGWDQITCGISDSNYCEVTMDGNPVYDTYDIYNFRKTNYYNNILSNLYLTQEEYNEYVFPEQLQINHSLNTLKNELSSFMNLDHPSLILPFDVDDLSQKIDDILNYLGES